MGLWLVGCRPHPRSLGIADCRSQIFNLKLALCNPEGQCPPLSMTRPSIASWLRTYELLSNWFIHALAPPAGLRDSARMPCVRLPVQAEFLTSCRETYARAFSCHCAARIAGCE